MCFRRTAVEHTGGLLEMLEAGVGEGIIKFSSGLHGSAV